jgi:hypothetical protein
VDLGVTAQQEIQRGAPAPHKSATGLVDVQATADWQNQFVREDKGLPATLTTSELGAIIKLRLNDVDFQYDQAVATMTMVPKAGGPTYRQTRFYRRTDTGWLRTGPVAAL